MSVIDRKNRARRQYAEPVTIHQDPRIAAFAKGCVRHHADDRWFHQSACFVTLSTEFAVELRAYLESGLGHQAGFVGHIAVELLLDAVIIERQPGLADEYYAVLASLDVDTVQLAANQICRQPVTLLVELLPRFIDARFIVNYSDDVLLWRSLNGVMKRIGLPKLPDEIVPWLSAARRRVRDSADQLLKSAV